ncbi:uncharacterized protein LOC111692895 [Anoplophora glabripennis]|uniref:uncharacterized protein LOC111692895 n=1 Tax=Anoplophora glabripennis TaxID=217634 RepID=UPI000C78B109|nr:uncharacterized protein LOC111692895 [Anoplophora glabripennis]
MGENALGLAETSVRNFGANPFESSDDEVEIRFGDGTISMVQNNWRNSTRNPFETIEESMEKRQLDDEALFIVQNASRNYATNPFDVLEEDELRQMGVDALSIAQTGARNVEATKRRLSENAEDIDNAFNSLIDYAELQNPVIEIGFDHLQHTVGEIGDADEKVTPTELKKN